ncbi:MAG: hypothetical protein AB7O59_14140 [Pirellulales bacterium]
MQLPYDPTGAGKHEVQQFESAQVSSGAETAARPASDPTADDGGAAQSDSPGSQGADFGPNADVDVFNLPEGQLFVVDATGIPEPVGDTQ